MLLGMDSSAAATGPLVVLCVAVLGLAALAVVAPALTRRAARREPAAAEPSSPGRAQVLREDDLAAFHARPPGFPGAAAAAAGMSAGPVLLAPAVPRSPASMSTAAPAPPPTADGGAVVRNLLALGALALVLVAVAAAVALAAAQGSGPSASPVSPSRPAAAVVPALPPVAESPPPGQTGAGSLAYLSLPSGRGDTAARLAFGGLILERRAVGVTVTYPGLSVTTRGDQALVHLMLPTFNCLTPDPPADPGAAGCTPSVTEYADLPTPALRMSRNGTGLVLQGRAATYLRPNGSPPEYTGRVYDLTVTVTAGRRLGKDRSVADGVVTMGSGTARTDGDPILDVLQRGR